MATLKGKYDPLRLFARRLFLVGLAFLVLFAAYGVWDIYRKNADAARFRHEAEAQLADLEAQRAKLQADYDKLQTERGKEEALRDSYSVGKEGEGMIMIVEPQQSAPPAQASSSPWSWLERAFSWWW